MAGMFGLSLAASACVPTARERVVLVDPGPAPVQGTAKRILNDGTGRLVLPDGTRVAVDATGGFVLPNGDYVRRDRAGALNLPNGARCVPDGRGGYACP
jgi:hypothetical protein